MNPHSPLKGVFPAVPTPLDANGAFHADNFVHHIHAMQSEGCDGIVVLGTTGEGPSMGLEERKTLVSAAVEASQGMLTIAATGCASLADTITLTRYAFEAGADAVLVIPPFYFRNPTLEGLTAYFRTILDDAVPQDGKMLLYHIPQVTQVPITPELLESLLHVAPDKVTGVKDSGGDLTYQRTLCERFPTLQIFTGSDRYLLESLRYGSAGCITAGANVLARLNVAVYDAFLRDQREVDALQDRLTAGRSVLEKYMPFPPTIKYLLSHRYNTSGWEPRPPLVQLDLEQQANLLDELKAVDISAWISWLG